MQYPSVRDNGLTSNQHFIFNMAAKSFTDPWGGDLGNTFFL